MEELRARLTLLLAAGGQAAEVWALIQDHTTAVAALSSNALTNRVRLGLQKPAIEKRLDAQLRLAEEIGARWLMPGDEGFPPDITNSPLLCLRGEWKKGTAVTIVGSREADGYGVSVARALGQALGESHITVVSGAARGIDQAAHRGALDTEFGRTFAVLGCGLAAERNREKRSLLDRIAEGGAVMSEYPIDMRGARWSFPQRNRLLAALAKATVVVQAAHKSGALITASQARALGRPVFAVPGDVIYPLSRGGNALLARGAAQILTHPRDLADATAHHSLRRARWPTGIRGLAAPTIQPIAEDAEPSDRVLSALKDAGGLRFDELDRLLGLGTQLPEVLVGLEIEGRVKLRAGDRYEAI